MKNVSRIITEEMGECWHDVVQKTRYNYSNGCDALLEYCTKCDKVRFVMWENYIDRVIALGAKVPKEHIIDIIRNIDYTSPEGFVRCWDWAISKEWWDKFYWTIVNSYETNSEPEKVKCLVNHKTFAIVLAKWLKEI